MEDTRTPGGPTDGAEPPADELERGLADFLEALRVEAGSAKNTLGAYRGDVGRFLAYARERGARRWQDCTLELVVEHLERMRLAGAAEASVARALSAVRMCLRHQVLEGILATDPLALLAGPRLRRSLP